MKSAPLIKTAPRTALSFLSAISSRGSLSVFFTVLYNELKASIAASRIFFNFFLIENTINKNEKETLPEPVTKEDQIYGKVMLSPWIISAPSVWFVAIAFT